MPNAIVAWFKERIGRGPTQTKAYFVDGHLLVPLRNVQRTVERTLIEHGQGELVERLRRRARDLHRDEICAVVARATERRVTTMLSDHDPATDTSALVFLRPGPRPPPGREVPLNSGSTALGLEVEDLRRTSCSVSIRDTNDRTVRPVALSAAATNSSALA